MTQHASTEKTPAGMRGGKCFESAQTALDGLMKGRTTILIAHRLSTVRSADRIAVLDHGVVREVGTHESLLENDGMYAQLVRAADDVVDSVAA